MATIRSLQVAKTFRTTRSLDRALATAVFVKLRQGQKVGIGDIIQEAIVEYLRKLDHPEIDLDLNNHEANLLALEEDEQ